jgi:hypothetical protein
MPRPKGSKNKPKPAAKTSPKSKTSSPPNPNPSLASVLAPKGGKQESMFPEAMEQMDLGHDEASKNPKPKFVPDPGKSRAASKAASSNDPQVLSYRHDEKRMNNPQVGMAISLAFQLSGNK